MSVQSWDLGQLGVSAQLSVVRAPWCATGVVRNILIVNHARLWICSNGKSVTCKPVLSAHLGRCSVPVPLCARAFAPTCGLAPSVCGNPASLAVAALGDSCYTTARAFPLRPVPAPSFPYPGASPYPWKSRPGSCPQGLCSLGTAHTAPVKVEPSSAPLRTVRSALLGKYGSMGSWGLARRHARK